MKMIIALSILVAVCAVHSTPVNLDGAAYIQREWSQPSPQGGYNFGFKASNGIGRSENAGFDPANGLNIQGNYEYIGPDNKPYYVTYSANKNTGFVVSPPY